MAFSEDFIWGAAAASYQIEGGAYDDDKGLSIWDIFCRQPGKVWKGNTGDIGCDHYHLYQDDISLMKQIGLKAYRLSVSWPRILPEGAGVVNQKGLAFYNRLIDMLLENDIEPWITLFHWDYPYSLFLKGGWLNSDSSDWFAEYTGTIVNSLSDRVTHWMTLNEPQVFIDFGHQKGIMAPGLQLGLRDVLRVAHNTLLAHGKAVQTIHSQAKIKPVIGAAPVGFTVIPATESASDIEAARATMFSVRNKDCWNNTWFADPMILGSYPEDGMKLFENDMITIAAGDMKTICQPLDFYGTNIYFGDTIRATESSPEFVKEIDGPPLTTTEWQVTPQALYWGPRFFYERYKLPIVITENGMANCDWIHLDGKVHDPQRIDFMARYLAQYKRASNAGIPCLGYFAWSILDNFEWAQGYKRRFGLVYVDYATKRRILKDSAYWYKHVIASNGSEI